MGDQANGTEGYVDVKISAIDCFDGADATCEVTASIGEFDGVLVGISIPGTNTVNGRYESVELAIDNARRMRDALTAAIECLAHAEQKSVDQ